MRDYNYRTEKKKKKNKNLKMIAKKNWHIRNCPRLSVDNRGNVYIVEGNGSSVSTYFKKQARKKERKVSFDEMQSGGNYKKHYPLKWKLF